MCDENKYSSIRDGDTSVEFGTFTEDSVLPDDVDREHASRSSLENCDVPNNNRYLNNGNSVPLAEAENPYYGKLIGIDADSEPYPEDLIMIGSTVDIRDDSSSNILLAEEHTLSENYDAAQRNCESVNPTSESGKTIMVTPEDIEAAGLSMQNLSELTEAQFSALVGIAERRQRNAEATEPSALTKREQYGDQVASSSSSSDSLTIVITDDGSLKLTDATGHTFSFDGAQLDALRIDVNNLTDENVQQIVQLAMPAINVGNRNFATAKADVERHRDDHALNHDIGSQRFTLKTDVTNSSKAVSDRLQMRESGRCSSRNACIRYIKNGKCKVQYEDGRFEWVGDDNVDSCENKTGHSDHTGYHAFNLSHENTSPSAHSNLTLRKRQLSTNSSFPVAPSLPKKRGIVQTPNFCCPICDRKVYQKEPSYIVIRLPACDDCTKERMIVLDERTRKVDIPSTQK